MVSALDFDRVTLVRDGAVIVEDVSFCAPAGAITALIGPNGAGKTSLIMAALGLLAPASGAIGLKGGAMSGLSWGANAREIAYVAQERRIAWPLSVEAVVALARIAHGGDGTLEGLDARGKSAVERALNDTGLEGLRARRCDRLSGGEQARVLFARALAVEAPLLIADEPVSGLDPARADALMRLMRARARSDGTAFVVVLHDLALAHAFADQVALIANGRLMAFGPTCETLKDEVLASAYGMAIARDGAGRILAPAYGV